MPRIRSFTLPALPAVLLAILSVQGGAALAKGVFPVLGPAGTSGLRVGLAALMLLGLYRPALGQLRAAQWRVLVPYGVALGVMNLLFYLALARIPLGLAVTLEFLGPLAVAIAGSRRWSDFLWVVLAGAGIALIAPWSGSGPDALGMLLAVLAGGCWGVYILLGKRVARLVPGGAAVAVGMVCAALVVLPFSAGSGSLAHLTPGLLLTGCGLALLSSALPYTLEMAALRTLPTRTFSILMSLEPAVAALFGLVLLHEHLSAGQWLAIGLVVAASIGSTLSAPIEPASAPAEDVPA